MFAIWKCRQVVWVKILFFVYFYTHLLFIIDDYKLSDVALSVNTSCLTLKWIEKASQYCYHTALEIKLSLNDSLVIRLPNNQSEYTKCIVERPMGEVVVAIRTVFGKGLKSNWYYRDNKGIQRKWIAFLTNMHCFKENVSKLFNFSL